MPPKSKRAAAVAGLVPDSIYRPHLAPKIARMADLRAQYARVAEVLLPALEELRARTDQNLEDDDHWHLGGPNHGHYLRFKAGHDAFLQRKIDLITTINTQKMENEAAKTGFAQQTVRDAYGRKVEDFRADRIADVKLERARFEMENGLREVGRRADGSRVERKRGWKRGMRS